MLQSAHNISALAQLAKKLWAKREKELELETENDGSICVLVCCVLACCVFLLPIHNHHHHHRRHRQETWTWNEAAKTHTHTHLLNICNIYYTTLSLWLSVALCALHAQTWSCNKFVQTFYRVETLQKMKKNGSPLKRIYLYFAKENCFLNLKGRYEARTCEAKSCCECPKLELSCVSVQHLIKYDNT